MKLAIAKPIRVVTTNELTLYGEQTDRVIHAMRVGIDRLEEDRKTFLATAEEAKAKLETLEEGSTEHEIATNYERAMRGMQAQFQEYVDGSTKMLRLFESTVAYGPACLAIVVGDLCDLEEIAEILAEIEDDD